MARYVLEVMYDGTQFYGSQIQGSIPTVQLAINSALSTLLRGPVPTVGASRTDEGVHALCNFYQFELEGRPPHDLVYKCNAILPGGVAVVALHEALKPDFNPRFDAIKRRYRYRIYGHKNPFLKDRALFYPYPLDFEALKTMAAIIGG